MINLYKTINQQREIFNGDLNIIITLKGSGKSYFMEQRIIELLKEGKNFAIIRNNQINIERAIIAPLISLLEQNDLLFKNQRGFSKRTDKVMKKKENKFSVNKTGIYEASNGKYRCLFGYMSSPTALDGCNLKASEIFYDEFLMIEQKDDDGGQTIYKIQKDLVNNFWRMVNTISRPNKPKIYMFANPHSPTCLSNDLITNKSLNFNISWDELSRKKIQEDEQEIKLSGDWGSFKCKIWVVPVDFHTQNSQSNELMEKMSTSQMFVFANDSERILSPNKPYGFKFQFNFSYKCEIISFYKNDENSWYVEQLNYENRKYPTYTHDEIYKTNPNIQIIKEPSQIVELFNNIILAKYEGKKIWFENMYCKKLFDDLYKEVRKNVEFV